jgi:hypothetical protein
VRERARVCAPACAPACIEAHVPNDCFAAGVTWTSRTANAGWDARNDHTSVIDAAGAIYVIGGNDRGIIYYHDVWVSTDGGADRTRAGFGRGGGTTGVTRTHANTHACDVHIYRYEDTQTGVRGCVCGWVGGWVCVRACVRLCM